MTVLTLILHAAAAGVSDRRRGAAAPERLDVGRPQSDPERHVELTRPPVWQMRLFIAVSLASNLAMLVLLGPGRCCITFGRCRCFWARWASGTWANRCREHDGNDDVTPSRSTYGWINWLLFNTGYHNEHHSFPNVAWTRLPLSKRRAPEIFTREAAKSYFGYWLDHVRGDFTASRKSPLHHQDNGPRCAGTSAENA